MKRKAPKKYDYYGFTLYYSVKEKATGTSIYLTYRPSGDKAAAGPGEIEFAKDYTIHLAGRLPEDAAAEDVFCKAPLFIAALFERDSSLRKRHKGLSLGVIWVIDRAKMTEERRWGKSTRQRFDKIFEKMIDLWGTVPYEELTVSYCGAGLREMSTTAHEDCAQALRLIFECEIKFGSVSDNPWTGYSVTGRSKGKSVGTSMKHQMLPRVLTAGEYTTVLEECAAHLSNREMGCRYFAVMLLVTLGISLEEICGLQYEDFEYLEEYPTRLTVRIRREYQKGDKNCRLVPILQEHRLRKLALSDIVSDGLRVLLGGRPLPQRAAVTASEDDEKAAITPPEEPLQGTPLVYYAKNHARYLSAEVLRSWIATTFSDLLKLEKIARAGGSIMRERAKDIPQKMAMSASENARLFGYESEELRYQLGKVPLLTSGKSYCDFAEGGELDKMGAVQDRWLGRVVAKKRKEMTAPGTAALGSRKSLAWWMPNLRCAANVTITLPKIAEEDILEDGLTILIHTDHGANLSCSYKEEPL